MANLEGVKVGDRVWLEAFIRGDFVKTAIVKVTSLTPKQIIVDYFGAARYWRVQGRRYRPGMPVDYRGGRLARVATPGECAEYDDQQERKREEAAKFKQKQEAEEAKRQALYGLFADGSVTIEDAERDGEYNLTFNGLTEAEVRTLADRVR